MIPFTYVADWGLLTTFGRKIRPWRWSLHSLFGLLLVYQAVGRTGVVFRSLSRTSWHRCSLDSHQGWSREVRLGLEVTYELLAMCHDNEHPLSQKRQTIHAHEPQTVLIPFEIQLMVFSHALKSFCELINLLIIHPQAPLDLLLNICPSLL
jgi:hypothetical protein